MTSLPPTPSLLMRPEQSSEVRRLPLVKRDAIGGEARPGCIDPGCPNKRLGAVVAARPGTGRVCDRSRRRIGPHPKPPRRSWVSSGPSTCTPAIEHSPSSSLRVSRSSYRLPDEAQHPKQRSPRPTAAVCGGVPASSRLAVSEISPTTCGQRRYRNRCPACTRRVAPVALAGRSAVSAGAWGAASDKLEIHGTPPFSPKP
jgi:hypothetical protein